MKFKMPNEKESQWLLFCAMMFFFGLIIGNRIAIEILLG